MTRCDFPSIMAIILDNKMSGCYQNKVEFVMDLFSIKDEKANGEGRHPISFSFDYSLVHKWLTGDIRVSPDICQFYMLPGNKNELAMALEERILPILSDETKAVQTIYDLMINDPSVSDHLKDKFDNLYHNHSHAVFLSELLLFAMARPMPQQKGKKLNGEESPLLQNRILDISLPKPCRNFTGRDTELELLHTELNRNDKVFVQGIPGIGKSELAKAYAYKYRKEYINILYLNYTGSLKKDIASVPFSDDRPSDTEDVLFRRHDRFLRTLKKDTLIIVDNFNTTDTEEALLSEILKYQCKILFTTKCTFNEYHHVSLEEILDHDILFELFSKYFKKASEHRKTVESILETVHNHTLSLELAARLLQTGYLLPEQVLAKLQEEKAAYSGKDIIKISKDGKPVQATYNQHIHTLFALFNLSKAQCEIMQCMSMMPLSGIPARLFASWNALADLNTVNKLEELGFLRIDDEYMLSLHPLMQDVVVADLVPSVTTCKSMICGIGDYCHRHGRAVPHGRRIRQIAENTIHLIKKDDKRYYLRFLEQINVSLPTLQSDVNADIVFSEITRLLSETSAGTAVDKAAYLANKAMRQKTEFDRIDLTKQAIEAFPEVTPENAHELYNIYGQLSHLYRLARDYEAAEQQIQIALDLAAQYDVHEDIKRLLTMNHACLLNDTHRHTEALKMMTLLEQELSITAPTSYERAAVLRKLAAITANCGAGDKGLSLLDESLNIYKNLCSDDEDRLQYYVHALNTIRKQILQIKEVSNQYIEGI